MNNVQYLARQAERDADLYSTYLRHVDVAPVLPQGVTVVLADPRACSCRSDECFFCVAVDDAVQEMARRDEEAELDERYGTGWHVCDERCPEWKC